MQNGVNRSADTALRTHLKMQKQQLKAARAKTNAVLQQLLVSRQNARQACLNLDAVRGQQHLPQASSSVEYEKFDQIVEQLERCIQQEPKSAEERQQQQDCMQQLVSLLHQQNGTEEDHTASCKVQINCV